MCDIHVHRHLRKDTFIKDIIPCIQRKRILDTFHYFVVFDYMYTYSYTFGKVHRLRYALHHTRECYG